MTSIPSSRGLMRAIALAAMVIGLAGVAAAQPIGPTAIGDPAGSRLIGRVTDMVTGRPMAGVRVRAGDASGLTDDTGVYRLSLPPGAYRIRVEHSGYQGVTVLDHEFDPLVGDGEVRIDVALPPLVAGPEDARKVVDAVRAREVLTASRDVSATLPLTATAREDVSPQRLTAALAVTEVPTTIRVLMPEGQIVAMATDEYLKGVVPAEMGWVFRRAIEALKAQAIASRTYAAAHCLPESAGDPRVCERGLDAHVDTTTRTQVWRPVHYDITDAAVEATSGLAARLDGALFSTLYFARAADRTLNSEDSPCCGGRSVDYLRSVASPDPFAVRYGHGAGLSQEGAAVLAEWGATAEEIIAYYYSGAAVAPDAAPAGAAVAEAPAEADAGAVLSADARDAPPAEAGGGDTLPASPATDAGTATIDADRFDGIEPGSITALDSQTILSLVADAEPDDLQLVDSPVIRADFPFMALAVRWTESPAARAAVTETADAAMPGDAAPPDGDVLVRVSADGDTWSDWLPMLPDEDGRSRSDDHWTRLIVARGRFVQLRMLFRTATDMRAFDQLDLHYFNADAGPSAPIVPATGGPADLSATADTDASAQSIEDAVIKRAAWGADESLRFKDGAEVWPPEYTVPKALIIHHTVTENDPADPAAVMRAIYYYHAVTRGWGDIGYNFLIDHRGNVYEGRFGGERNGRISQGGHALQFNTNSIGVALLGTFTDVRPPAASETALVSFCAAKAFRYRVDPQAGVTLLGTRFAHGLMGHRDALPGHTACPGNAAYPRLDAVRTGVAALVAELGGQPTTPPTAAPTARPSATATRRPTAVPPTAVPPTFVPSATGVPTPPAGCTDAVANGGFEADGDQWLFNRAVRTRWDVFAGAQSAFIGLRNDDPDNGTTYASIVQTVTLPRRTDRATLRFAFRSTGDDGDRRLVRLMDGQGRVVALGDVSLPASTPGWVVRSLEVGSALSALAGQPLRVYFGVVNNGDGRRSYVRVDEVRLEVCPGPAGQTVDPTASATASRTAMAGPTATLPATAVTPSPPPGATRTAWPTTGPTPTRGGATCGPLLADGGFEPQGTADPVLGLWRSGGDLPVALTRGSPQGGSTHGGVAAVRLGPGPTDLDRFGYASIAQDAALPAGVITASLSLWVKPDALSAGDALSVEIRRTRDGVRRALPLPAGGLPPERWTLLRYSLEGSTLGSSAQVYIALLNRRQAEAPTTSGVLVDDVRLDVCASPMPAIAVPFLSVDRP